MRIKEIITTSTGPAIIFETKSGDTLIYIADGDQGVELNPSDIADIAKALGMCNEQPKPPTRNLPRLVETGA